MSDSAREETAKAENAPTATKPKMTCLLLDKTHTDCNQTETGQKVYSFDKFAHGDVLLNNIRCLWQESKLIDVRMVSSDRKQFEYHGVLLAACSHIMRKILASEQAQMYNGMLAPRDVKADVLTNLTYCLYRPEAYAKSMKNDQEMMDFAQYFDLTEALVVNKTIDTSKLLTHLHQMFTQRCMTYSRVKAEQMILPCHSLVLAAASPKLRADILLQYECPTMLPYEELQLEGHNNKAVALIVEYIYTAELKITDNTAAELLYSACELNIVSVVTTTCHFIKEALKPETSFSWREVAQKAVALADDGACKELIEYIEMYIIGHFEEVMVTQEFKELAKYDDVWKFMVKANLEHVEKRDILSAMVSWFQHNKDQRLEELPHLLTIVSIIKDQDGLMELMNGALSESKKDIFGILAMGLVTKKISDNVTAQDGTARNEAADQAGAPNQQKPPTHIAQGQGVDPKQQKPPALIAQGQGVDPNQQQSPGHIMLGQGVDPNQQQNPGHIMLGQDVDPSQQQPPTYNMRGQATSPPPISASS